MYVYIYINIHLCISLYHGDNILNRTKYHSILAPVLADIHVYAYYIYIYMYNTHTHIYIYTYDISMYIVDLLV